METDVFAAAADVPVLGRSIVRVLATADPFALLGRDLINRVHFVLDGPHLSFEIGGQPGGPAAII